MECSCDTQAERHRNLDRNLKNSVRLAKEVTNFGEIYLKMYLHVR